MPDIPQALQLVEPVTIDLRELRLLIYFCVGVGSLGFGCLISWLWCLRSWERGFQEGLARGEHRAGNK